MLTDIIEVNRRIPHPRRIAILGAEGSHTHRAFLKNFKSPEYETIFFETPEDEQPDMVFPTLIKSVAGKHEPHTDCALIPFHNSSERHFNEIPSMIIERGTFVVDICRIEVPHSLLATKTTQSITELEIILSNRHCFLQSCQWLAENAAGIKQKNMASSSEAAKYAATNSTKKIGVIGSEGLAKRYDLKILHPDISKPRNFTSFFVVSGKERTFSGNPFSLYAIPIEQKEDKAKIIEIIEAYLFQIKASWFTVGKQNRYIYYLFTGDDQIKVKSFENLMANTFKGFERFGRLNKNIADYTIDN